MKLFSNLPELKTTIWGDHLSQLCLLRLVLQTSVLMAQQLPDALRMTGERKLWSSNTIKLSGNVIGQLIGVLWPRLLWGDNESHHSLLGWKKRGLPCGDGEWGCVCVCVCAHPCVCSVVSSVQWGSMSKQQCALTKLRRSLKSAPKRTLGSSAH